MGGGAVNVRLYFHLHTHTPAFPPTHTVLKCVAPPLFVLSLFVAMQRPVSTGNSIIARGCSQSFSVFTRRPPFPESLVYLFIVVNLLLPPPPTLPHTINAFCRSGPLSSAMVDVYLGKKAVSPGARKAFAAGVADLLGR